MQHLLTYVVDKPSNNIWNLQELTDELKKEINSLGARVRKERDYVTSSRWASASMSDWVPHCASDDVIF